MRSARRWHHDAWYAMQDLTLPLISLFTGRGFDRVIRETFQSGPQRIEDLWLRCCATTAVSALAACTKHHKSIWWSSFYVRILRKFLRSRLPHAVVAVRSYFCVTTNLSKGEPAAHCRGKLWRLVRASMTIVGLVPPVFYQGDLLIDGGYLNNMPVDVMHAMGMRVGFAH